MAENERESPNINVEKGVDAPKDASHHSVSIKSVEMERALVSQQREHAGLRQGAGARFSQEAETEMCEAYVTLGRLSHVKERHSQTTAAMSRSLVDAGAGTAVEAAMSNVRSEYEAIKERLERLYRRSMGDLNAHKLTVEGPTLARIELVAGQQNTVEKAEDELKVLMANPNEEVVMRELPGARRRATKTLKSSIKLLGLRLPEVRPVTVADFPRSRLHNVVLANKPSGDQSQSKDRTSDGPGKTTHQHRRRREERHERQPRQQQERRPGTPRGSPSQPLPMDEDKSSSSQSTTAAAAAAAAAVLQEEKAAAASMAAEAQSCCRTFEGKGGRSTAGWDEGGGKVSGGVTPSATMEGVACSHCACACRSDDVWAAYRTLRKRYHVLKDHADKEELRVSVEEQRIGMQSEFDLKRGEMQAEFDERKREMDKELARRKQEVEAEAAAVAAARLECRREEQAAAAATAEARAREAAAREGGMGSPSQMELQSLRDIVQALFEESRAVHQELAELRGKVAVGEASVQEAQRKTMFLEEEVVRRKQHGEILLARIRFLKGKTAAYVENNEFGVAQGVGGSPVGGEPNARHPAPSSSTPAESDYGSDSDIDAIARRNEMAAAAATCAFQDSTAERHQRGPFARSDSDSDAESSSESDVSSDVLRHPAFPRRSSDDGRDEDDFHFPPEELPRARGAADWMEVAGRYLMEAGSGREGESGDFKARRLEREREHLTREVHKLSAQLASSGVTTSSAGTSVAPDAFDHQPRRFFASPVAAPAVGGSPPRSRGRQQGQAAAMAAAAAAEAAEVAVAAVGRAAKDNAAPRRRHASRRQRGDGGGGSARGGSYVAPAGDGGVHRRRQPRETATPNKRGRSPAAVLSGFSDDDTDGGSATSCSRSVSGSPSWRPVPRRRQQSPTLEKVFHSQPQRQRQRRERGREWRELSGRQENLRAGEDGAFYPWGQVSSGHGLPEVFDDSASDGTSSGDSAETSGDQFW